MNIFDEEDKKIESILKAEIYEPDSYTNAIKTALNKKNTRVIISLPKIIAAIIATAMLISGAVYAKQIGEFIRRIFNENIGMDTAAEYGYIEIINKEFETNSDTKIKLNNFLMDDYNIDFVLDFDFLQYSQNISSISIPDLIITDESNNILYCQDKNTFDNYCKKNNLELDYHIFNTKYINTVVYKNQTFNEKYVSYNIKSTTQYPKSNKIFMSLTHIIINYDDGSVNDIQAEWKIEIYISKLIDRRIIKSYKMIETSDSTIKNFRFETYNTGTIIQFNAQLTPYITDNMTDEEKEIRKREIVEWIFEPKRDIVNGINILNKNGDTFLEVNSNMDDEEERYKYDGSFYYKNTLDLTQYEMTDTLTLYFTIHTINEYRDVVIKLKQVD